MMKYMLVLLTLFLAGCGGDHRGGWGDAPTRSQRQKLVRGADTLGEMGMPEWASRAYTYIEAGRIAVQDLETGYTYPLDAMFDPIRNVFIWNKLSVEKYPRQWIATIWLDELAHQYYQTADHEEYEKLDAQFFAAWAAAGHDYYEGAPQR